MSDMWAQRIQKALASEPNEPWGDMTPTPIERLTSQIVASTSVDERGEIEDGFVTALRSNLADPNRIYLLFVLLRESRLRSERLRNETARTLYSSRSGEGRQAFPQLLNGAIHLGYKFSEQELCSFLQDELIQAQDWLRACLAQDIFPDEQVLVEHINLGALTFENVISDFRRLMSLDQHRARKLGIHLAHLFPQQRRELELMIPELRPYERPPASSTRRAAKDTKLGEIRETFRVLSSGSSD